MFFHRQGEIRDRTFENQSFRASDLSLITAATVHFAETVMAAGCPQAFARIRGSGKSRLWLLIKAHNPVLSGIGAFSILGLRKAPVQLATFFFSTASDRISYRRIVRFSVDIEMCH